MKMKNRIKLIGIIIIIMIVISTNVKAFTLNQNARVSVIFDDKMPYHYEAEEKVNYKQLTYDGHEVYTLDKNNDLVIGLMTDIQTYEEEVCQRILENGYPAKTYQELGLDNEQEAYFATQEAIYAYFEHRDMDKYIIENEKGERILQVARQILEIAKKEEANFTPLDKEWKDYEVDTDFMYKQYKVFLNNKIESADITIEDSSNVEIRSQDNTIISNVKNGDIVKIVVPRSMNQLFKVKLSYERQGAILKTCFHESYADKKYLVSEIGQVQKQVGFCTKFQNLASVTITNYNKETKEKIGGNVFSILDEFHKTIIDNLTTDENGTAQILLEKGNYYIKQIQGQPGYSLLENIVKFQVKSFENMDLNIYNTKEIQEETQNQKTQTNITQENKKIIENDVTDVTNIHNANIEEEMNHTINEINFENTNRFLNTTYQKNIKYIEKQNIYRNNRYEELVAYETVLGKDETKNMTRDEYITYMDYIKIGSLEVPNLPVALKQ